jgi:hypothetical protein
VAENLLDDLKEASLELVGPAVSTREHEYYRRRLMARQKPPHVADEHVVDSPLLPVVIPKESLGVVARLLILGPHPLHPWRDAACDDLC